MASTEWMWAASEPEGDWYERRVSSVAQGIEEAPQYTKGLLRTLVNDCIARDRERLYLSHPEIIGALDDVWVEPLKAWLISMGT